MNGSVRCSVADTLNGSDYRARTRLSNAANVTLAHIGETCERVPAASLPSLLASGEIVPVENETRPAAPVADVVKPRRRKEEV
jgi:hypothetical protein